MNMPRRQFPSVMTFGVSAIAATLRPLDVGPFDLTLADVEDERDPAEVVHGAVVERGVARTDQIARARLDVAPLDLPGHHGLPSLGQVDPGFWPREQGVSIVASGRDPGRHTRPVEAGRRRILVTGATGKVGQAFIRRVLAADDGPLAELVVRALCHSRVLDPAPRLEVVRGSIAERDVVEEAVDGVTHVLHLATSKETPETIMDVAVKGLFWLLEACRASPTFEQFILDRRRRRRGPLLLPARPCR